MLKSNRKKFKTRLIMASSLLALSFAGNVTSALAKPVDFNIETQSLAKALNQFSEQADLVVMASGDVVAGKISPVVFGAYEPLQALELLLASSGLRSTTDKSGAVVITKLADIDIKPGGDVVKTVEDTKAARFQFAQVDTQNTGRVGFERLVVEQDEIVVSATRRNTSVKDVPYNIQVISSKVLEDTGARSMSDLVRMIPGLSFTDTGARDGIRVFLRGLRSGDDYGLVPTTSSYLDDTLIIRPSNFRPIDLKVVDIEQVEVLRGPQGTLYGGGSIGGTIRYISKKPNMNEWSGRVGALTSFTDEGGTNYEVSGMMNAPIIEDKVALRVNAGYFDNDGFIDNINLGVDNTDWDRTFAGRAALRVQLSDQLTIDLSYHHEDAKYGEQSHYDEKLGQFNTDFASLGRKTDMTNLISLNVSYDLGFAEITANSSYIEEDITFSQDATRFERDWYYASLLLFAGNPYPLPQFTAETVGSSSNISSSQELRIVSKGESNLDWIFGGYLYDSKANGGFDQFVTRPFPGFADMEAFLGSELNDDRYWRGRYDETYDQWALFGELGYQLTDKWHVSIGMRHYDFQRTGTNSQIDQWAARDAGGFARPFPIDSEISSGSLDEDGEVFRFNTSYDINENSLIYATVAQGYRPGGFNVANSATQVPEENKQYESDSLVSYELGGKFGFADNRIFVSSALYYIDWSDMQTQIQLPTLFGFRGNAGKAHSQGFEVEINARDYFMDGLAVGVNYAYTDAKLDETINTIGLEGERVPMVPLHTASVMFDYVKPLESWDFGVNLLATYTGTSYTAFGPLTPSIYGESANDSYLKLDGYALVNLSLRLEKDDWTFRLFANNLLNNDGNTYRSYSMSRTALRQASDLVTVTRPRTVGLEMTKRF